MPLGVKSGKLKVPVSETKTGVGASAPSIGAAPVPAIVARSENVGERVKAPKASVAASALALAPALALPAISAIGSESAPAPVISAPALAPIELKVSEVAEPKEVKVKVKEVKEAKEARAKVKSAPAKRLIGAPPEGAITAEEWMGDMPEDKFQKELQGPNPVETVLYDPATRKPVAIPYAPVTTSALPDFIIQTYIQYSPFLKSILDEAIVAAKADGTFGTPGAIQRHQDIILEERKTGPPKEFDRDACKRRNPEKRELFYYQKFVRDYLSRGTPYRGLLLYHGLGSGKTCASIAAAEALYWGGQKKIYILTPASLSNNYRKDIAKCGFYPLRQNNFWQFLKIGTSGSIKMDTAYVWLTETLGLPADVVEKQGGGWVATPDKPSNWDTLSPDVRGAIKAQQAKHLEHRFHFIHYNGVIPAELSARAAKGVESGIQMFDNAVVVIDEVHNLVRTINGTKIGAQPISKIMSDPKIEPREATWSAPLARATKGYNYPRAYTLYRLLQNAVGAKIIVLSATPMINYAQEMAILLNIIGGELRVAEIPLGGVNVPRLEEWIKARPDVDYYKIDTNSSGKTVLNITPVPYGFMKVVRGDYSTRGFVRLPENAIGDVRTSRERNMEQWATSLIADAKEIITDAPKPVILTLPLLPEDATEFVDAFINKATLEIMNANKLKARAAGLISYYRGGSEELMPREGVNQKVEVEMSEYMFKVYSIQRLEEIAREPKKKEEPADGGAGKPFDLYAYATKGRQTGFLAWSRAACNWVFPEEVQRPKMTIKDKEQLLGVEAKEKVIAVDAADADAEEAEGEVGEPGEGEVAIADEAPKAEPTALDARLAGILGTLMSGLESNADQYLNKGLAQFSPKYLAMIEKIRESNGPVLVYSQFLRLEGLGIFAAALRASAERYIPLEIVKVGGEWEIPEEIMVADRPRYIMYTGEQDREKRRLLLQLYNADIAELPPKLAAQCRTLLAGAEDNRDGRICRIFMITQSGAEGISLSNTRQVHVMEPYWNNVRILQVIGRAIRLCSHMNLPWEDRVVDVFRYVSVFSAKQKAEGSKQIMSADKGKTTDEIIYDIAVNKQKLADGLSQIIQSAAVDCQLHSQEHGGDKAVQCYTFKEGARPMFMYHPDWRKDDSGAIRSAAPSAP
jgi:hypothetical protein